MRAFVFKTIDNKMPLPLDRIPLPNLKTYSCGSVLALSACIYFATQVIKDPNWNIQDSSDFAQSKGAHLDTNDTNSSTLDGRTAGQFVTDIFTVMIREPICVWVNTYVYNCGIIEGLLPKNLHLFLVFLEP